MNMKMNIYIKKRHFYYTDYHFGSFSSVQLAWIIDAGWWFWFQCICFVRMHIDVLVYRTELRWAQVRTVYIYFMKTENRNIHAHTYDETMTTTTKTTSLNVWTFDFVKCMVFSVWLFTRLVNSFIRTHNMRMNKWKRKKGESIILHAARLLNIYVFLMMFCYKLHSVFMYDDLISVCVNENHFSATFMRSLSVCMQQRCHTNRKW